MRALLLLFVPLIYASGSCLANCCKAHTAECLACGECQSVEEYCAEHPVTFGCPDLEPSPRSPHLPSPPPLLDAVKELVEHAAMSNQVVGSKNWLQAGGGNNLVIGTQNCVVG